MKNQPEPIFKPKVLKKSKHNQKKTNGLETWKRSLEHQGKHFHWKWAQSEQVEKPASATFQNWPELVFKLKVKKKSKPNQTKMNGLETSRRRLWHQGEHFHRKWAKSEQVEKPAWASSRNQPRLVFADSSGNLPRKIPNQFKRALKFLKFYRGVHKVVRRTTPWRSWPENHCNFGNRRNSMQEHVFLKKQNQPRSKSWSQICPNHLVGMILRYPCTIWSNSKDPKSSDSRESSKTREGKTRRE